METRKTKNVWRIVANNGRGEVIDTFDTFTEARAMLCEYSMAFKGSMGILKLKAGRERVSK